MHVDTQQTLVSRLAASISLLAFGHERAARWRCARYWRIRGFRASPPIAEIGPGAADDRFDIRMPCPKTQFLFGKADMGIKFRRIARSARLHHMRNLALGDALNLIDDLTNGQSASGARARSFRRNGARKESFRRNGAGKEWCSSAVVPQERSEEGVVPQERSREGMVLKRGRSAGTEQGRNGARARSFRRNRAGKEWCPSAVVPQERSMEEMVPRGGIEPPTLRFSVACSTN